MRIRRSSLPNIIPFIRDMPIRSKSPGTDSGRLPPSGSMSGVIL